MIEQGAFFGECLHPVQEIILETKGPHHSREICSSCRRFIRWIPSEETIKKRARNREMLAALSKLAHLTEWERQFIRDLSSTKNISPKQQVMLDNMRDKYCGQK